MKCLCRWNAKNKKKLNFCLFAEGNDQGPRQRRVLCRGPSHCPRQRFIGKILEHFFAEGHGWRPSAKTFLKKIKISLPRACGEALGKDFSKKKRIILCRGPSETALGKDSVPGAGAVTAAFLCRVPDKGPSAKTLFADLKFLESSLTRTALGKAFAEGLRP